MDYCEDNSGGISLMGTVKLAVIIGGGIYMWKRASEGKPVMAELGMATSKALVFCATMKLAVAQFLQDSCEPHLISNTTPTAIAVTTNQGQTTGQLE